MRTRLKKEDKIREAAYFRWLDNPHSSAFENWVAAEQEYKRNRKCCREANQSEIKDECYKSMVAFSEGCENG